MESSLKKLVEISNYYGSDPEYVIAGGGNTSFKNEKHLWIKASGTSMATITESGFVKMDRSALQKISEKTYSEDPLKRESEIKLELHNCIVEDTGLRPSVETSLHNLINSAFVVHTHPTWVNALMCAKNSSEETAKLFGTEALVIEYTDPGYILFKLVEKKITEYVSEFGKDPVIIFLENHGVFVSADTIEEIKSIYRDIDKKIKSKIDFAVPSINPIGSNLTELTESLANSKGLKAKAFNCDLIQHFVKDEDTFKLVGIAFSPDNIVYCKAHYLFSGSDSAKLLQDYESFEKKHGYYPKVIGIKKLGLICLEENEKSLNTVYEVFLDMMKISYATKSFGGPRFMTARQIEFIDNWEVENYRRKIAKT